MKTAIKPLNLLAAPSSCSMNSSAFCSAASLTASLSATFSAWCCVICSRRARSVQLDAFFREVLDGAGVEGDRRGRGLLAFQLEVLRFLVHGDQVGLLLED